MSTYTAKTLDDALKNAASDLNVAVEELEYTVTEEKAGGFLGIGASVTIEASVKQVEEPVVEEVAVIEEEVEVTEDVEEVVEETEAVSFTSEDVKEFLFDYLGNYFMGIGEDLECAIEERDGSFIVNLNAENNAVLIGKMGKTLAAFNTVVRAAVNAQFKKRIDVLVDVNHYKEDRYSKLRQMAKRIGKQVQKSHVDVELDPMPNDERKVIHKTLSTWHNLKTQSEGEGANRHLCIRYVADPTDE